MFPFSPTYDQLYAQLYAELEQGRRYWFEDEENARIMQENEQFQRVSSYELMVEQVYMAPEDTPGNAPFVLVKDIMQRLAQQFSTFSIRKNTDREIGKRLLAMGYQYKRHTKGSSYQMEEKPS